MPEMREWINRIICGNALQILKILPDESIDCCITSPPYWAVRDYGNKNQIGLEEHPQEYIDKIVEIIKELKRCIKKEGSIWLNLGDSYYSKSGSGQGSNYKQRHEQLDGGVGILKKAHTDIRGKFKSNWLQNKQRLLIPSRIAIKCQDDLGLVLRNDIHWIKQFCNVKTGDSLGSSMPTSVQDRLNTNAEYLFFFVKDNDYYFNLDEIRIPHRTFENRPGGIVRARELGYNAKYYNPREGKTNRAIRKCPSDDRGYNKKGKNPGDVILFPLEHSKEKHYAIFPSTLPQFCIKAGCPESGIVLDPFAGSGTTCLVAKKLGRQYLGIELNPEYIKIAERRLLNTTPDLFSMGRSK